MKKYKVYIYFAKEGKKPKLYRKNLTLKEAQKIAQLGPHSAKDAPLNKRYFCGYTEQ